MTTELGLRIPSPEVTAAEVAALCDYLDGRGWVRASEMTCDGIDDRKLRAIASASRGRILSGQRGYRLFDDATPIGEAEHCAAWLRSQGLAMLRRACEVERRVHDRVRRSAA